MRPMPFGMTPGNMFTLCIAVAGALAYSSWPLGFLVNPSLAGTALASSFEGRSQPFSWLFILLDCFAGLCTVIVCVRFLRSRRGSRPPGKALVLALLGYAVFGVTSAVDAAVPLNCGASSARACAAQLWPVTPDDLLTGIAVLGLFAAVAILAIQVTRARPPLAVPATVVIATTVWSAMGLVVLLGGTSPAFTATVQYAFLTATSLLMLLVPAQATVVLRHRPSGRARVTVTPAGGSRAHGGPDQFSACGHRSGRPGPPCSGGRTRIGATCRRLGLLANRSLSHEDTGHPGHSANPPGLPCQELRLGPDGIDTRDPWGDLMRQRPEPSLGGSRRWR